MARISREVNDSDPDSDQGDQEIYASATDDTDPGSAETADDPLTYVNDEGYLCNRGFSSESSSDNGFNGEISGHGKQMTSEDWNELWKLRCIPTEPAEYCPSVSTISVIDSEDEGTLPYALKRIQRDFPRKWKHHPLGSSHDDIYWHPHRLRVYGKSSRGRRDPSVISSLQGKARSILKGAETSRQRERAYMRKVVWDDDSGARNIARSQRLSKKYISPQPRRTEPNVYSRPIPPEDDTDEEEERRRLRARVVDDWLDGSLPRPGSYVRD